jgi:hypothetical protein
MEYLVGFFSSFILIYFVAKVSKIMGHLNNQPIRTIKKRQSDIHAIVYPLLQVYHASVGSNRPRKKTQSMVHEEKNSIKVIIMDNNAYWIKDNVFYTAEISIDGNVNKDTTRVVDIMTMNRVQLDKMLFIVDKLREGIANDSGGKGN